MKKQLDQSTDAFVVRHLSQLKMTVRLFEHELAGQKPGANPTFDRDLVENFLDVMEIFIDDVETKARPKGERGERKSQEVKEATVTRLN